MRATPRWAALGCLLALCLAALGSEHERPRIIAPQASTVPQDPADEVVRVNTRAVFIDTLVKDKRTGEPVEHRARELAKRLRSDWEKSAKVARVRTK